MNIQPIVYITTLVSVLSMPVALAHSDDEDERGKGQKYEVELVPLNNSGVEAEVEINLRGQTLTVSIEASGLERGNPHPQHIHGHGDASLTATCPGIEADVDGDGLISVGEGLPSYGPIILPLIPFDLVDAEGKLNYKASFTVNPSTLQPLGKRSIILHGMTVFGQYIPSLPIACGTLERGD